MFKNWRTTGAGCVGGLPLLVEGITAKDWGKAAYGLGLILVGFFAKDSSKSE
jgi:hypothetical protein